MFRPPDNMPPERILLYGMEGSGKSKSAHSIAARLVASGSRNRMWIVDTDFSWRRFLAAEGDPGNVQLREVGDWGSFVAGITEAQQKGQPGDWVVIDHIGVAWEMAQDSYITQAYGKDPVEFLLEAKKMMKKNAGMGAALSGMGDWPFIKRMYRAAMNDLLFQSKLHVIGITTSEKIWESDMPDVQSTYNRLGGKPGGEKHLAYGFHSVLQMGQNYAQGTWWFTTAKDRGRPIVQRQPVADFSTDYLAGCAGWVVPQLAVAPTPPVVDQPPLVMPVANGSTTETPAEKLARLKAMRDAR